MVNWVRLNFRKMKKYLLIILLYGLAAKPCFSSIIVDSLISNNGNSELLLEKSNMELTLSNPGIPGKFFVIGDLSFYDKSMTYQVYADSVFLATAREVHKYNYMIKDFEIPYSKISKVRGGFFFLFLHRKVIVELDNKITYKFIAANSKDRREILKFISARIN